MPSKSEWFLGTFHTVSPFTPKIMRIIGCLQLPLNAQIILEGVKISINNAGCCRALLRLIRPDSHATVLASRPHVPKWENDVESHTPNGLWFRISLSSSPRCSCWDSGYWAPQFHCRTHHCYACTIPFATEEVPTTPISQRRRHWIVNKM